jgi:hypothetical protein
LLVTLLCALHLQAFNALQEKVTAFNTEEWEALVRCFAELLPAYDLTLICSKSLSSRASRLHLGEKTWRARRAGTSEWFIHWEGELAHGV